MSLFRVSSEAAILLSIVMMATDVLAGTTFTIWSLTGTVHGSVKIPTTYFRRFYTAWNLYRNIRKPTPNTRRISSPHAAERDWYSVYADMSLSRQDVEKILHRDWREIGIDIACYDKDNATLLYPIKITYDKTAVYEACAFSWTDPNQGWSCSEDEDEDEY